MGFPVKQGPGLPTDTQGRITWDFGMANPGAPHDARLLPSGRVPLDLADKVKAKGHPVGRWSPPASDPGEMVKVSLGNRKPKVAKDLYREARPSCRRCETRFSPRKPQQVCEAVRQASRGAGGALLRDHLSAYGDDLASGGQLVRWHRRCARDDQEATGTPLSAMMLTACFRVLVLLRTRQPNRLLEALAGQHPSPWRFWNAGPRATLAGPQGRAFPELQPPATKPASRPQRYGHAFGPTRPM
jgi:hypothetical protein